MERVAGYCLQGINPYSRPPPDALVTPVGALARPVRAGAMLQRALLGCERALGAAWTAEVLRCRCSSVPTTLAPTADGVAAEAVLSLLID